MNAELYENGELVATIEAPPYEYEYTGDDERLQSVLQSAERISDWKGSGRVPGDTTPTSGPETIAEPTPEEQFSQAVAMAADLGYAVLEGQTKNELSDGDSSASG